MSGRTVAVLDRTLTGLTRHEHDAAVSYATVRDYVTRLRAGIPDQGT